MKSLPKLLILGGSGFLGSHLTKSKVLKQQFAITSTYHSNKSVKSGFTYLDCTDMDKVEKLLEELQPKIVINCVALTDVDFCQFNPEISLKINQIFPIALSKICFARKIKLIQISTDHFESPILIPRTEETEVYSVNYYGAHKLEAENGIIASGCKSIILRTNFFGIHHQGKHLLNWVLNSFRNENQFTGYTNVHFSPLSIEELSLCIQLLIYNNAEGLFNLSSNESISKFEFASLVAEIKNISAANLIPGIFVSDPLKSPRPLYLSLSNRRFATFFNYQFPSIRSMLTQVLNDDPY